LAAAVRRFTGFERRRRWSAKRSLGIVHVGGHGVGATVTAGAQRHEITRQKDLCVAGMNLEEQRTLVAYAGCAFLPFGFPENTAVSRQSLDTTHRRAPDGGETRCATPQACTSTATHGCLR